MRRPGPHTLQHRADVVGQHDGDVVRLQHRHGALDGVELRGDRLDAVWGDASLTEPLDDQLRRFARAPPSAVVVFLHDEIVEISGEAPDGANVLIATIAWCG